MNIFGKNQPEKPVRRRKARSNPWFRDQVKNSGPLLDSVKESSPMLRAAIVSKAIGRPFGKNDIVVKTLQQRIEDRITDAALDEAVADPDFIEASKQAILEGMYVKAGAAGRRRLRRGT